jgi:hypothetical protein
VWEEIAEKDAEKGRKAYAHKQAAMYRKLCVGCEELWASAPGWLRYDEAEEVKKAEQEARKAVDETGDDFIADYSVRPAHPESCVAELILGQEYFEVVQ